MMRHSVRTAMKRGTILAALVGAAAAMFTSGSEAAPSDLCVGSKPGCFSSIQAAVDAAQDGDRIEIGPGTFAGGITIGKSVEARRRQRGRDDASRAAAR